jgi:hypothetical protein
LIDDVSERDATLVRPFTIVAVVLLSSFTLRSQNITRNIMTMRHVLTCTLIALLCIIGTSAHRIDIRPGKKECFFEDLHHEDQVSGVVGGDDGVGQLMSMFA